MNITSANELRSMFLKFFESKGHKVIPSASVIPENDPTVLFTTAGMHPLVPYLMGEKHPMGTRLTDVQKCIRTGDIDDVGDPSHLTFFEMLGNWSLGDYFKKEMIPWSWEFLTSKDYLGIEPDRLAFTVFAGDEDCPRDEEAANLWRSQTGKCASPPRALSGRFLPKARPFHRKRGMLHAAFHGDSGLEAIAAPADSDRRGAPGGDRVSRYSDSNARRPLRRVRARLFAGTACTRG